MRRRRLVAGGIVLATIWVACTFSTRVENTIDAPPDAGPCKDAPTFECAGSQLLRCVTVGLPPERDDCGWGCKPATAAVVRDHCGEIMPKGGAATIEDTRNLGGLGDIVISAAATIDGGAGTITGHTTGFMHDVRGSTVKVAVFRMKSLTINAPVRMTGSAAIAFVTDGPIIVNNLVDVKGPCGEDDMAPPPGPGGYAGGQAASQDGLGPGGGKGAGGSAGGGGGGHGGSGGAGGSRATIEGGSGGSAFGDPEITMLVGGGGGGGTDGAGGRARGGGGGGALQLVSNTKIVLMAGGIDAGGCGGDSGAGGGSDGGGGGGAGGAILLEAPIIEGPGALAVNGGGGGAGDDATEDRGKKATLDRMFAAGALGNGNGGSGGSGAAADAAIGTKGVDQGQHAGGGGGGIGRIRFHTINGGILANGVMSPAIGDPNSTCTAGSADVR